MTSLVSLVKRNLKVFFRDRTLVFFSLLSILIVVILYALFLQKMQVDSIGKVTGVTPEIEIMVNEWLVAGLLSMVAVTATLGAFSVMVQDIQTKVTADFLTAPISRPSLLLSYVFSAFIVGIIFTFIALLGSQLYLVATGGNWFSFHVLYKMIGILLLSVFLASMFNLFIIQFVKSQGAFSTLSTIVGTLIGFLCGVYVPLGLLPTFAQNLIMYFPISHTTVLLRDVIMNDSIQTVFKDAPIDFVENYKLDFGVIYEMNGVLISSTVNILIILVTAIVLCFVSILIFKRRGAF
ncbi:ABC transporter permease [Bacillus sp. JCM 19034]|uniref:ABC transporter permease n=1 Tax=Bacillus sp. JCM 19034 TaxID=1481928 RepID=UPI000785F864|nr:ABC transporter permease [Bacillus sp. JCM 19034]